MNSVSLQIYVHAEMRIWLYLVLKDLHKYNQDKVIMDQAKDEDTNWRYIYIYIQDKECEESEAQNRLFLRSSNFSYTLFWPFRLLEHGGEMKLCCFKTAQFVAIYYSNPKKLT